MSITDAHKENFETIRRAFRNGDVCLLECTENKTGETVYLIAAIQHNPDGSVDMTPLAQMFKDDPYELYTPPAVDSAGRELDNGTQSPPKG